MQIVDKIDKLQDIVAACRKANQSIGFVPTMGALHQGHLSLVQKAVVENEVVVVSIFVNPTQFNDVTDLQKYPRTLEQDMKLLETISKDLIIFVPTSEEVYPTKDNRVFSYPPIDSVMEGEKRPGHFNGVCQIVSKLFDWVTPDRSYFGEKDFQQIAVVRVMMKDKGYSSSLVSCPIVREKNGLALSSRNMRLSLEERQKAGFIYHCLEKSLELYNEGKSVNEVQKWVIEQLGDAKFGAKIDYFSIVDGSTLQPISSWKESNYVVGCLALFYGKDAVRLIDNIIYKK